MNNKQQIFCWHTGKDTVKYILTLLFVIAGALVFFAYRKYAAAGVVSLAGFGLLGYQMRFVIVEDTGIWQLHWMKKDVSIPLEEIERIDTRNQSGTNYICIYGKNNLLEMPYRVKTVRAIFTALGISQQEIDRLLAKSGEDFEEQSGNFVLKRSTVQLDSLVGKKQYSKIEVKR